MIEVDEAIFDRLSGDATLTAMLAQYQGAPAILSVVPIPPGVVPPFVVVPATLADTPGVGDTKNTTGRRWVRDIGCYARADGDPSTVERIAERVRALFFRQHGVINIAGFAMLSAEVFGPIEAPTDRTIYGRIVTVTLTAMAA